MLYLTELMVFWGGMTATTFYFVIWYSRLSKAWPPERGRAGRIALRVLPPVAFGMIVYTLFALASFDVAGDFFYVLLYICFGFAWIYAGIVLIAWAFDLSWIDDVLNMANSAAAAALVCAFLAVTLIYCGANVGDGPGWWTILVAGGMGMACWLLLGMALSRLTGAFERITIGRDMACGIRTGAYLLGSGIILARASAGDWTSFGMTVVEFLDGWPVLILAAAAILVEFAFSRKRPIDFEKEANDLPASIALGVIYVAGAVAAVLLILPPLRENPVYNGAIPFIC